MATTTGWRILLADDHMVVRAGLRALLTAAPSCEVVGEASNIAELLAAANGLLPDLIVLDLSFGSANALDVVPELLAVPSTPRIVVLTMHDDVAFARQALARGVHGYLIKETAADDLLRAVEMVMSGCTYLHPELGARLIHPPAGADGGLSLREREVLGLAARGHTNVEIARRLAVSLRTVESHRANLRTRLGITSRAELVDAAQRLDLLP